MAGRAPAVAVDSVGQLLTRTSRALRGAGSPTARLDAELLAGHVLGRDRAWLVAHPEMAVAPDDAARITELVARRAGGEPVAYLRGFKDWFGLRIAVDRRALIPRPETELLAEAAIREVEHRLAALGSGDGQIVVWDVATGSGAVAVALGTRFAVHLRLGRVRLVASDLDPDALELAAENLARHRLADRVTLAVADLLEPAGGLLPRPDVVTANLPYLTSDEVARAEGSIAFEPPRALDGGTDGLDVLRRLVAQLPRGLGARAAALLEIGAGQAEPVERLIRATLPGVAVSRHPDLAGIDRVVTIAT